MRIFIPMLLTFVILFAYIESFASFEVSAEAAILMDFETGLVIYEKNSDKHMSMASTTKIITAITAIEHGNLSDVVTVSANAAQTEGSSVWLTKGEKLTLKELLYALMLESGNDAAVAVAEHIAGSEENFAKVMNEICKKAGAKSTSCVTSSGLDDEFHYTTAYDLAKITQYAMMSDVFREIVATYKTTIPWDGNEWDRTLVNHNKLLNMYPGVDGVKTGYTKKSGRCLVSSAEKDGRRIIAVTLNAPDDWNDHTKMLNYAFENFNDDIELIGKDISLGKIRTPASKKNVINFGVEDSIYIKAFPFDVNHDILVKVPNVIYDSINTGDKVGTAEIFINDTYFKTVDLIALDSAQRNNINFLVYENLSKLLKALLYLVR